MNDQEIKKISRGEKFVGYICNIIAANSAKCAALKRADNPALEYQSWEILSRFGVDLTHPQERRVFSSIAAMVAKAKIIKDGHQDIGAAIANCYEGKSENDQALSKLRRLIACNSIEELCSVLRPLHQLILSKQDSTLNYGRLLDEIIRFQWKPLDIKAIWSQNFYFQKPKIEEEENVC